MYEGNQIGRSRQSREAFLTESHYLLQSEKKNLPPKELHEFFEDHPFQKVEKDKSRLKPMLHEAPREGSARKFIVIQEEVKEGRPLSKKQLQKLLMSKKIDNPQIITYGTGTPIVPAKPSTLPILDLKKEPSDVQIEQNRGCGRCCC